MRDGNDFGGGSTILWYIILMAAVMTIATCDGRAHELRPSACTVEAVEIDCGAGPERIDPRILDPVTPPPAVAFTLQPHLRGSVPLGWARGQVGQPTEWWNLPVDALPVSPQSLGVITYLSQAERAFNGDPAVPDDALQTLGDPTPDRQQSLNWRLDRGRAYHPDGTDWEGYGQNVHVTRPGWRGIPFALLDAQDAQVLGEDSWFGSQCDKVLMPNAPMPSPRFPDLAPRVRLQENPSMMCGPDQGDIASDKKADCHYNVIDMVTGKVYEQWRARGVGLAPGIDAYGLTGYSAGCTAVFDLSTPQDAEMRGWSTTSANVAGVPYTPFLVTPGEIEAGEIKHAIAVAFYNHWLSPAAYVRAEGPNAVIGGATHAAHATVTSQYWQGMPGWSEDMIQPAVGSRFRLRADFVIDPAWPRAVRILYVAMKKYGVYVIDGSFGGTFMALSNDAFDAHSWTEVNTDVNGTPLNLHPLSLELYGTLGWQDFEMLSVYEFDDRSLVSRMPGYGLPEERDTQRSARYPVINEF